MSRLAEVMLWVIATALVFGVAYATTRPPEQTTAPVYCVDTATGDTVWRSHVSEHSMMRLSDPICPSGALIIGRTE